MSKNESLVEEPVASGEGTLDKYEVRNSIDNNPNKGLTTPFGPFHYMVAAAGLSLILFVIYVVYQQARLSQNVAPEISDSCEHRFCARVQLSNPSCRCLLGTIAMNRSLNRISTSFENAIVTDYSSAYPSDLPPSYVSSVRYDCPPSYEEAICFNYHANHHI